MMDETTFYKDDMAQVTSARVLLGSRNYALSNITSVAVGQRPVKLVIPILTVVLGIIIGSCVGLLLVDILGWALLITMCIVGLVIFAANFAKPRYIVQISSTSGEVDAVALNDKERIQRIVDAINEAIAKRE